MAAKFGVNITVSAEAARPISVESTTPIGIAGYEEVLENGLHFYMTTDKAITALEEIYEAKKKASEQFKKRLDLSRTESHQRSKRADTDHSKRLYSHR